jgi:hypothetical protein
MKHKTTDSSCLLYDEYTDGEELKLNRRTKRPYIKKRKNPTRVHKHWGK